MGLFGKSEYERQVEINRQQNALSAEFYEESKRQQELSSQQLVWFERQLKATDEGYAIQQAQQARYERLLETWEKQAQRFDAILKKWEEAGPK